MSDGTGSGLFDMRSVVRTYGGAITLESIEGKGTTFTIRLPIADRAMAAKQKDGGIDLDPAQMTMDVKKEDGEFRFDFDPKGIDLNNIEGAEFIIRQMTPVTDLPLILGPKTI